MNQTAIWSWLHDPLCDWEGAMRMNQFTMWSWLQWPKIFLTCLHVSICI